MLHIVVTSVCVISGIHVVLGLISVVVGIVSSIKAEVWLAHSVSPIWSGGFFIITGILGIFCARRKTSYVIMCFTAFSVVSMVTAVVSIQLLRLGLVNHTTDGHTFQKQNKDILIIIALAIAGSEIIVCLVSTLLSCRMAKVAKEELCKRREGMFHVKAESDENDNDVIFSSVDCEDSTNAAIDAVEIHVMDEYGFEIQKDNIDCENTDSLKDLEQSDEDADNHNNTSDNQANDVSVTQENTEYSETESIHNMEADINERDDSHLKNKLRAKKHKSKEMKKPMQIFTVLEEEISDVSDIETPRT